MNGLLTRLGHGMRALQLGIMIRGLLYGGFAFLLMGVVSLADNRTPAAPKPVVLEGVVTGKTERPIPGFEEKIYLIEIAPDAAAQARVSRTVGKQRWDATRVGDRWTDPAPARSKPAAQRKGLGDAIRSMAVGAMMLAAAAFLRRRLKVVEDAFEASKQASASGPSLAKALGGFLDRARKTYEAQRAATRAAAASPAVAPSTSASRSTPPPKPTRKVPATPVRRASTVTRAGWI